MDGVKFLSLCKRYYLNKRYPIKNGLLSVDNTDEIVQIAQAYFESNNEDDFAGFFMESQYLVNLWAAHLLLAFGKPSDNLYLMSLEIITRYSSTPLNEKLAVEEKEWLKRNNDAK